MRSRFRLAALLAVAALLLLATVGLAAATRPRHHVFRGKHAALSAAAIRRLSAGATKRSIIIFRNQLTGLPARGSTARARASAAGASQAQVRAELTRVHAKHVRSFQIINAISATVSAAEVKRLQANPAVKAVVPDAFRRFSTLGSGPGPALPAGPAATSPGSQQVCPSDPSKPLIEPEARTVMNVPAAQQIVDGSGIKVGIIADGIDPNNPDLVRPNGQHVIFDYQDFSGFGTARQPTAGRPSSTPERSPPRAIRPTTCPVSSTPRTRYRRGATSRSRASPPAPAWPCSTWRARTRGSSTRRSSRRSSGPSCTITSTC